jgi:hypothetical protein
MKHDAARDFAAVNWKSRALAVFVASALSTTAQIAANK